MPLPGAAHTRAAESPLRLLAVPPATGVLGGSQDPGRRAQGQGDERASIEARRRRLLARFAVVAITLGVLICVAAVVLGARVHG